MRIYIHSKKPQDVYALIDDEDADLTQHRWHLTNSGYALCNKSVNGKRKHLYIHRLVAERLLNRPLDKGEVVDHINHNKTDNRRSNIRVCTHSQNHANAPKRKALTSKYKGVYLHKRNQKWCARITVAGKGIWLGTFTSEVEAAKAYDVACQKYYGKFAHPNFP